MNNTLDIVPRAEVAGGIGDGRVDRQCMSASMESEALEVGVGNSLSDAGIVRIGSLGLQAEVEHCTGW